MAGRKQVRWAAAPAEASTRSPKRALENGADESPAKKAKFNHNQHLPSQPNPPRFWHQALGATNPPMQPQQYQMVMSSAVQAGWGMHNTMMMTNNNQAYPGYPARWAQSWDTANTEISQLNAANTSSEEKNNGKDTMDVDGDADHTMEVDEEADEEMEVDEEDEETDWDDEVEAVMAGVRHSLANAQPLVDPDWNQHIVDKRVKRAARFMAGRYR